VSQGAEKCDRKKTESKIKENKERRIRKYE
jgi:hypothetical protein